MKYVLKAGGHPQKDPTTYIEGIHRRGYLPHIKREGASYFVTFRLADSLPKSVLRELQERFELDKKEEDKENRDRDFRRAVECYLDLGVGECWLKNPEISLLVAGAMKHFDGERYLLKAWVIMPNHVHAVIWPKPNYRLDRILQSIKGFSARRANGILGRVGEEFWQRESFDRWIRAEDEEGKVIHYIENNPVKAGLCSAPEDWRWGSAWDRGHAR